MTQALWWDSLPSWAWESSTRGRTVTKVTDTHGKQITDLDFFVFTLSEILLGNFDIVTGEYKVW